jgi:hypothetical protein
MGTSESYPMQQAFIYLHDDPGKRFRVFTSLLAVGPLHHCSVENNAGDYAEVMKQQVKSSLKRKVE